MDVKHHLSLVCHDRKSSLITVGSPRKISGNDFGFFNTLGFRLQRRRSHLFVCQREFSEGQDNKLCGWTMVDNCDVDLMSMFEIQDMMSELIVTKWSQFLYTHPPFKLLKGLLSLMTNNDVLEMINTLSSKRIVRNYVLLVDTDTRLVDEGYSYRTVISEEFDEVGFLEGREASVSEGGQTGDNEDITPKIEVHSKETSIIESMNTEDKMRSKRNYTPGIKDLQVSMQDNATPFVSALKDSAKQNAVSFHFPGHNRGRAAPSSLTQLIGLKPFTHDLPDLPELDNLFSPEGPILEAQRLAAKLFGSSETWFLVGGTTCGIQAAIMATCSPGEFLILPRNCHISAISAMVLSGVEPKYIIPDYDSTWDIGSGVSPAQVDKGIQELKKEGQKVGAVFITSPTYHGICSNLSKISLVCHSHGIPLIVDEAHGAHFGFHPHLPKSALKQGADLAVQSTHKVLSSLTQSSMLHMAGNIVDRERICRCLQMLQSTSPSNLLLASLDAARAQISENPDKIFNKAVRLAGQARNQIKKIPGISVFNFSDISSNFPTIDPLRITVGFQQLGLSGNEVDDILYDDHKIVCELVGAQSITYAINLGTREEDIEKLVSGIENLRSSSTIRNEKPRSDAYVHAPFTEIQQSLNPRDAFFASKRRVEMGKSIGEVCGELICPYPPGMPALIPGEIITKTALDYLLHLKSKGTAITGASDSLLSSIVVCNVK